MLTLTVTYIIIRLACGSVLGIYFLPYSDTIISVKNGLLPDHVRKPNGCTIKPNLHPNAYINLTSDSTLFTTCGPAAYFYHVLGYGCFGHKYVDFLKWA